jgi:translation initiation factor IF-2
VRLGSAEVREVFRVPKIGSIAGCMVTDGIIKRSGDAQARLLRDHVVAFEGKIGSLRRFKDDVSEVKSGFECGIGFERFNDIKVGDVIEVFVIEKVIAPVPA